MLSTISEVIKFNIGGQRYEVSRSLFDKHPDSMLARSESEQWQEDPEAEIFIERDGLRFRYILDYMRDDKLDLLPTESKKTIVTELEYYGIVVNEENIDDAAANSLKYAKSMAEMMKTLEGDVSSTGEKHYAAKVAIDFIELWCTKSPYLSCSDGKGEVDFNPSGLSRDNLTGEDAFIFDNLDGLHNNQFSHSKREASVNFYLNQVGLQVRMEYSCDDFTVKQLDA